MHDRHEGKHLTCGTILDYIGAILNMAYDRCKLVDTDTVKLFFTCLDGASNVGLFIAASLASAAASAADAQRLFVDFHVALRLLLDLVPTPQSPARVDQDLRAARGDDGGDACERARATKSSDPAVARARPSRPSLAPRPANAPAPDRPPPPPP